ncbi:WEB family protein At1g75720-like [Actinidia eriantha]|uniref:WEB family protein At1g75720-like n=1 Tax=Actinidia eriantha TaxID=165200 RepID=UPI00258E6945|nr:WEB family protein At1g75720-like [Actinidia eriantha]
MEPPHSSLSTVDTSRPFTSVKEVVAMFSEKFLVREIYSSPGPFLSRQNSPAWRSSLDPIKTKDSNDQNALVDTLKRFEAELEEMKAELKLLKEREIETEVAVASLNAELHKNMSKIARVEAQTAAAAAASASMREEEKRRDLVMRMEDSPPTLGQILSPSLFGCRKNERKVMKKRPIVPLVGNLFSRRKVSSTRGLHNSLLSSPHMNLY